jgi:hypothetical protein
MPFSTIIPSRASACAFMHVTRMVGGAYRSVHLPFHPTCVLRFRESVCLSVLRNGCYGAHYRLDRVGCCRVGGKMTRGDAEWVALPQTTNNFNACAHTTGYFVFYNGRHGVLPVWCGARSDATRQGHRSGWVTCESRYIISNDALGIQFSILDNPMVHIKKKTQQCSRHPIIF